MHRYLSCLVPLVMLFAPSCDSLDDESDIAGLIASAFVTISVDEADLAGGTLTSETAVESSSFLANIREKMGTIDSVKLSRIELRPAVTDTENVDAWADAYTGELTVQLVPASAAGAGVAVGKVAVPASGLELLAPQVTVTQEQLDASPDIAAGRFTVRLTAASPRAAGDTFLLPVRVELEFIAF